MSTKEAALLDFWFRALWTACQRRNDCVSAGTVAAAVGQSRGTAKKYIDRMIQEGAVTAVPVEFRNGTTGYLYSPVEGWK